ncbi:FUSC family protein [Methylobacterium sp. CM6247]
MHGLLSAGAAVLAYLPTQALNQREGFWSAITAIAVLQTEFRATRKVGRDQLLGAATGGLIGLGIWLGLGQHLASYALAVILSLTACWLLNVASAARLAGITATIILLVPHDGTAQHIFGSRVMEVGWGVTVAIIVGWLATRLARSAPDVTGK